MAVCITRITLGQSPEKVEKFYNHCLTASTKLTNGTRIGRIHLSALNPINFGQANFAALAEQQVLATTRKIEGRTK